MGDVILTMKGIDKSFPGVHALDHVDLEIRKGEVLALMGENGAGKSTLMNIIADVIDSTSGEVLYDGEPIKKLGDDYRRHIGYLPQKVGYYGNFTAANTLEYFALLKGLEKTKIKESVKEILEKVNLQASINDKVKTFSGGMKQRLGIAIALIGNPDILILDEPTVGLDPKERINFRNVISELAKDKIIILSTHIVSDVDMIAQYIILIKKGELIGKQTLCLRDHLPVVGKIQGRGFIAHIKAPDSRVIREIFYRVLIFFNRMRLGKPSRIFAVPTPPGRQNPVEDRAQSVFFEKIQGVPVVINTGHKINAAFGNFFDMPLRPGIGPQGISADIQPGSIHPGIQSVSALSVKCCPGAESGQS